MGHRAIQRTVLSFFLILFILLWVQVPLAAERASVQEIISNPDKYDGQEVTVPGKAFKVRPRTSKRGNEYTTLLLTTGHGRELNIFAWGRLPIREGQTITVTGIYLKVKRVGKHTFYNEIEAKEIK